MPGVRPLLMTKEYKVFIYVILAFVLIPLLAVGACVVREKRYERGYAQLDLGDTKRDVAQLLGEPAEVQVCDGPVYSDGKVTGECAEKYYYHSFLESWGVLFDKDGRVIGKFYNVSG
jgi:hypothetical protein